jgi:hypothetical protein
MSSNRNRKTAVAGGVVVGLVTLGMWLASLLPSGSGTGVGIGSGEELGEGTGEGTKTEQVTEDKTEESKTEPVGEVDAPGVYLVMDDTIHAAGSPLTLEEFKELVPQWLAEHRGEHGEDIRIEVVRGRVTQGFLNQIEQSLLEAGVSRDDYELHPVADR